VSGRARCSEGRCGRVRQADFEVVGLGCAAEARAAESVQAGPAGKKRRQRRQPGLVFAAGVRSVAIGHELDGLGAGPRVGAHWVLTAVWHNHNSRKAPAVIDSDLPAAGVVAREQG